MYLQVKVLVKSSQELDGKFLQDFLKSFAENKYYIYPALACFPDPDTDAAKIISEFFRVNLADKESHWVSRHFSEPIIHVFEHEYCTLTSSLTSWVDNSSISQSTIFSRGLQISPYFQSISGLKLNDALEQLTHLHISNLKLENTRQLTDEGMALALSKINSSLKVLELENVEAFGDVSIAALAKLENLQRLTLTNLPNLTNSQMEIIFKGKLADTLEHLIISTYDLSILSPLSNCKKLTYFQLANQREEDLSMFCILLGRMKTLKHLSLESVSWVNDNVLKEFAKLEVIKNLKSLHLAGMSLTGNGVLALGPSLNKLEVIKNELLKYITSECFFLILYSNLEQINSTRSPTRIGENLFPCVPTPKFFPYWYFYYYFYI